MGFLILIPILLFIGLGLFLLFRGSLEATGVIEPAQHLFEKKPFVFDKLNELNLYRDLVELFGDRYYVFPQVVYSRLVQTRQGVHLVHRTKFDKKIADFVLCDKQRAVAKLVIELDGPSHNSYKRRTRDERVDAMMQEIGLPILHLKPGDLTRDYVKGEVERVLTPSG